MADKFFLDDILAEVDAKRNDEKNPSKKSKKDSNLSVTSIVNSEELKKAKKDSNLSVTSIVNSEELKKAKKDSNLSAASPTNNKEVKKAKKDSNLSAASPANSKDIKKAKKDSNLSAASPANSKEVKKAKKDSNLSAAQTANNKEVKKANKPAVSTKRTASDETKPAKKTEPAPLPVRPDREQNISSVQRDSFPNNKYETGRNKRKKGIKKILKGKAKQLKKNRFLFEELVKRDFTKKYKRTVLGILWSVLGPLVNLTIMTLVFSQLLGRNIEHYVIYLFCGNLLFSYFSESTNSGMVSLYNNSGIFSKVNVPKYLFLFSSNISSLINFGINLLILFLFCAIEQIVFTWKFILLLYPIMCLVAFNIGMGLILSALYVMFRDMKYLYGIFTQLLMYLSAIFYSVKDFDPFIQKLFFLNPVYVYIHYFRQIIIDGEIPGLVLHLLGAGYALAVLIIGFAIYKKKNYKFLYYI